MQNTHTSLGIISSPGQLKIKYPDVTGDFILVDLVKGGTGLGTFTLIKRIPVCQDCLVPFDYFEICFSL